jgi:glutaminyl-peptide cyclotransferase
MKTDYLKYTLSLFAILLITWTLSCSGRPGKMVPAEVKPAEPNTAITSEASVNLIKMIAPEENTEFKLHDQIKVVLALARKNEPPDSVTVYFNGKSITTIKGEPWECFVPATFIIETGRKSLKVTAYKSGKSQSPITRFMIIFSDIVPKIYGYRIVHTFPHDNEAFTQGLIYDSGKLYEGTGQKGESNLREVELESGKVIRQHNIDNILFGEGITLLHDRIYEVTWQNKVGFVYDRATFNLINKIYYPMEGWGLTTVDEKIVLSDGTNVLYYIEPDMFTVVSKIEVYDNEKKIDSLNELEYINGEIWANIWMTDLIARIDPLSGKVLSYVNLEGILPENERNGETDVLNGIAYDKATGRIFVTGKKWPKLFEIKISE